MPRRPLPLRAAAHSPPAARAQYSINKSKALLGFVGQQWEQHIVAELDSALNKWIDSVPDHREHARLVCPSAAPR